jgi:hypothetical protein
MPATRKLHIDPTMKLRIPLSLLLFTGFSFARLVAADEPIPVTIENFVRAETDLYFDKAVKQSGLGELRHRRVMAEIDKQDVVRMNRDTIYSSGVFDLAASPLTVTLPDPGRRFMSMQVISQDHFTTEVAYAPGRFTYTPERVGTRYVYLIIRTFANPGDTADMTAAHALQDGIQIEQESAGTWETVNWDPDSRDKIRDRLEGLNQVKGETQGEMFGRQGEADPVLHLLGTAIGWGGNPRSAAIYPSVHPRANDGKTAHRLTIRDVPVDGFWSVSVYNEKGFFEKNDLNAYSVNSLTAKPNADGSFTIQFGGDPTAINYLAISPGWNYTVRLYRPRKEILDGTWKLPEAQPGQSTTQNTNK